MIKEKGNLLIRKEERDAMKVVVYCRNDDPYSQMVKNLLNMNEILFENREISRDKDSFEEMYKLSGQQSTPVLVINEHVYAGFDREMIKEILKKEKDAEALKVLDK